MKQKQQVDFTIAMILLFIGIVLTILPILITIKVNYV